jgi:hypothetical protein
MIKNDFMNTMITDRTTSLRGQRPKQSSLFVIADLIRNLLQTKNALNKEIPAFAGMTVLSVSGLLRFARNDGNCYHSPFTIHY